MVYPSKNYTLTTGTDSGAPKPVIATRDPTGYDTGYNIGTEWVNTVSATNWFLTKISGTATWSVGVTGTVTVPQGGTGAITLINHGVLLGQGVGVVAATGVGTNGQLLCGATGADPVFTTLTSAASTIAYTTGVHTLALDVATSFMAQTAVITLTTGQILALRAAPITVVAAPAAGKVLHFLSAQLKYIFNTIAYTNPQNMAFKLKDGTGAAVSGTVVAAGFIDQAAGNFYQSVAGLSASGISISTAAEAQPIVIHNTGGSEITAGNGTIEIIVQYQVLTM